MSISPVASSELEALLDHIDRQIAGSGRDGAPLFTPQPRGYRRDRQRARISYVEGWARGIGEPGWIRTFVLHDGGRIVGHAELRGGHLTTELHRAVLGMGIEAGHRRRGHGKRLLGNTIDLARAAGLAWIDLLVFEHNLPALALYRAAGFAAVGRVEDRFRIDGQSVTDLSMTLRLR